MLKGTPLNEPSIVKLPEYELPDAFRGEIDGKGLEEGATIDNMDPSRPFLVLNVFDWDKVDEWIALKTAWIAKRLKNDIIIPDPVPQIGRDAFFDITPRLTTVLEKDSVRCFLPLFVQCESIMTYQCAITSETLTHMVRHNALRCAKVVLEGKAAELRSNVRTASDAGIQGLLPLDVAVENACMHKYLEDNLSPTPMQYHEDYIYKLIHLLCLPEMKVFLDTIRLLAEKTDNLVDELWNYMKNGKLVQTAVLLLAAQKHIRKIKPDGFCIITHHLFKEYANSLRCAKGDTGEAQKQLEEREALLSCKSELFSIILLAGEALDNYIQAHSEVSHAEVLARVSSILKEFGFCPKEKCIDNIKLSPYMYGTSYCDIFHKGCE
ncbi:hypothetical protein DAI22_10g001150 [Oryza sativa Japonica Group]|nr:hypothetical protein DAI22_10g001150 [Oryza sativa Japonica Group]